MTDTEYNAGLVEARRRAFGLALRLCADRQDAEDVTQEALVLAWNKRAVIESQYFALWTLTTLKNILRNRVRLRQVPIANEAVPERSEGDGCEARIALLSLDHEEREAVRLVYECGMTVFRAAKEMHMSRTTLAKRVRSAQAKLKEAVTCN